MEYKLRSTNGVPDSRLRDVFLHAINNPFITNDLLKKLATLKPIDLMDSKNVRGFAMKELSRRGIDNQGLSATSGINSIQDSAVKDLFLLAISNEPPEAVLETASTFNNKAVRIVTVCHPKVTSAILENMMNDCTNAIAKHAKLRLDLSDSLSSLKLI